MGRISQGNGKVARSRIRIVADAGNGYRGFTSVYIVAVFDGVIRVLGQGDTVQRNGHLGFPRCAVILRGYTEIHGDRGPCDGNKGLFLGDGIGLAACQRCHFHAVAIISGIPGRNIDILAAGTHRCAGRAVHDLPVIGQHIGIQRQGAAFVAQFQGIGGAASRIGNGQRATLEGHHGARNAASSRQGLAAQIQRIVATSQTDGTIHRGIFQHIQRAARRPGSQRVVNVHVINGVAAGYDGRIGGAEFFHLAAGNRFLIIGEGNRGRAAVLDHIRIFGRHFECLGQKKGAILTNGTFLAIGHIHQIILAIQLDNIPHVGASARAARHHARRRIAHGGGFVAKFQIAQVLERLGVAFADHVGGFIAIKNIDDIPWAGILSGTAALSGSFVISDPLHDLIRKITEDLLIGAAGGSHDISRIFCGCFDAVGIGGRYFILIAIGPILPGYRKTERVAR